jgi:DNA-binding NtrC family response regulator
MASLVTILVVEDEVLIRMDLVEYLRGVGFDVLEASDAATAMHHLEDREGIQVLVTDIDMPGRMDGLMLAANVAERWPSIRIIFACGQLRVSAAGTPTDSVFVPKPYSVEAIERLIQQMLV